MERGWERGTAVFLKLRWMKREAKPLASRMEPG